MADARNITLHALGAEATTGAGASADIESRQAVKLELYVAAVTGTLTVSAETSPDNATWRLLGAFSTVAIAPAVLRLSFDRCDRYVRARWTLSALGSGVFAVLGKAHQLFATREDLGNALPAPALAAASTTVITDALITGSCDVEDALGTRYPTPLTKVSESVVRRCAQIAAYGILMHDGFKGGGIDELVAQSERAAQQWLKDVAASKLEPVGIEPTPSPDIITTSGNPDYPDVFRKRMSDNWGDFG